MKNICWILFGILIVIVPASGQFKSEADHQLSVSPSLVHSATGISSLLGLFNPDNFMMRHNFSLSYLSSNNRGISLASYTNSMFYKIADPLDVRFDVTLQGSPTGDRSSTAPSALNGLFLSRAELNYKPWQNFSVNLQYRQTPFGFYRSYFGYPSLNRIGDE